LTKDTKSRPKTNREMRCFLHFSKELFFNYIVTSIWMITYEQLL